MRLKQRQAQQEKYDKKSAFKEQSARTFYENMSQLYQLKQQLIHMQHIFSPDLINYHQMSIISKLKTQINQSQQKMRQSRKETSNQFKEYENKIEELTKQKQELLVINEELVKSNTKLAEKLQSFSDSRKNIQEKAQELQNIKNAEILRLQKQIDNIKLMHAQELYILRKKSKKNQK